MRQPKRMQIKRSYSVCFSKNGSFLASTAKDVVLWSCPKIIKLWRVHPISHPAHLAFSPNSSLLAVKSTSGHILLLSTSSGEVSCDFHNKSDGEGGAFIITDDGSQLIDGSWKGSHIVRTLDGKTIFREEFFPDMITGVLRHPSGRIWFRHNRRAHVPSDGTPKQRLLGRDLPFTSNVFQQVVVPFESYTDATFSPDGNSLVILAGQSPYILSIFTFPAMEELKRIELPPEMRLGRCLRFSPCGSFLAVAGSDSLVILSSIDLSIQRQIPIPYGCDVDFSPTDFLMAAGSWSAGEVFTTSDLKMNCLPSTQKL